MECMPNSIDLDICVMLCFELLFVVAMKLSTYTSIVSTEFVVEAVLLLNVVFLYR